MDEAVEFQKHLTALLRSKILDLIPEVVDGKKVYVVLCRSGEMRARLPFRFSGGSQQPALATDGEQNRSAEAPATRAVSDLMIKGTASSTSEDWYGTEMSGPCLMDMAVQFNRGVALMPSHGTWSRPLEWDDQMGITTKATIEQADVAAQSDPMEQGYKLSIEGKLRAKKPKCLELVECLDEGQKIGMSIGGWFLEIRYIMSEDECEIERIIVERVELDHLAIVRNPANPDCTDLQIMRSVASEAIRGRKAAPAPMPVPVALSAPAPVTDEPQEQRGATPYADLPLADEAEDWSFDTAAQDEVLGDNNWARYKRAHAWYDPANSEAKAGYKLPFAKMIGGSLKAVWNGVAAAMAALNGARGGVDIPADDKQAVYNHLKRYYSRFDKEAPDLKSGDAPENNRADPGIATQTETENKPEEARATEINMTKEDIEAMIADAVRRGVEAGRASAGAAPAETQEQELLRLRSENEALRNVRNQPRRSGNGYVRGIVNGDVNPQSFDGLFNRTKQLMGEDASLVRCIDDHKAAITLSSRARGEKGKQYRSFTEEAPEILREICCAAEDDGLIGDMQRGWML